MQREQLQTVSRADRRFGRREWDHVDRREQQQSEAREHARLAGKSHRDRDVRAAEADRQIRELRARY